MFGDGSVRWCYNGVPWVHSTSPSDIFSVDADKVRRPLLSLTEEVSSAVKDIQSTFHGEQIHILFSGGSDSEVVLRQFINADVPIKAIILHDQRGANWEELTYAKKVIDEYGDRLDYDILSFDFRDWINSSEAEYLANETQTTAKSVMPPFYALLCYKDKVCLSGGIPELITQRNKWYIMECEEFFGEYKLRMKYNIKGICDFWGWSTELYTSWVSQPIWEQKFNDFNIAKSYLYKASFGVESRYKIYWNPKLIEATEASFRRRYIAPIKPWITQHV
jgi:hypothetical protein